MMLDRAPEVIESGIERGLHIGAQLYVSQDGKRVADLAFGLAREGVAMTPDIHYSARRTHQLELGTALGAENGGSQIFVVALGTEGG